MILNQDEIPCIIETEEFIMQAYEFSSVVEKEGIIHIPQKYLKEISSPVKVIILADEKNPKDRTKHFSAMTLETSGFKFNREEANDR